MAIDVACIGAATSETSSGKDLVHGVVDGGRLLDSSLVEFLPQLLLLINGLCNILLQGNLFLLDLAELHVFLYILLLQRLDLLVQLRVSLTWAVLILLHRSLELVPFMLNQLYKFLLLVLLTFQFILKVGKLLTEFWGCSVLIFKSLLHSGLGLFSWHFELRWLFLEVLDELLVHVSQLDVVQDELQDLIGESREVLVGGEPVHLINSNYGHVSPHLSSSFACVIWQQSWLSLHLAEVTAVMDLAAEHHAASSVTPKVILQFTAHKLDWHFVVLRVPAESLVCHETRSTPDCFLGGLSLLISDLGLLDQVLHGRNVLLVIASQLLHSGKFVIVALAVAVFSILVAFQLFY